MEILCENLNKTKEIANAFANCIGENGAFVALHGGIGVGKTTFTRFLLQALGVKENVTSPSFVLLNEYRTQSLKIYHFDLYRLEFEGIKTIAPEFIEYCENNSLALVEWADFAPEYLPQNRIDIEIQYGDLQKNENSRIFNFSQKGDKIDEKFFEILKGEALCKS